MRLFRRRDERYYPEPRVPDWHQPPPGKCASWLRALGAISCGYPCDLRAGHAGMHECTTTDPIYFTTNTTYWGDLDADERNSRSPYFDAKPRVDLWRKAER